jgi:hypothetical protein
VWDFTRKERLAEAGNDRFASFSFSLARPRAGCGDGSVFPVHSLMLCPDAPIFDVMREALLFAVEIDSADPLTLFLKRRGNMHRDRRLT